MNIIFTLLFAFAIGFFVKQRGLAIITYLALGSILFTYQTLNVLLEWMGPMQGFEGEAFGPKPTGFPVEFDGVAVVGYGAVNLIIFGTGVGLVVLGAKVAAKRAAKKQTVSVS